MATTPPPPKRLKTPPTPKHGTMEDYEPYSPRRSSRVAARKQSHLSASPGEELHMRRGRASTPTKASSSGALKPSSQTFSPPTSPASPFKSTTKTGRVKITNAPGGASESDSDMAPSSSKPFASRFTELGMPTPSKTPRKRASAQSSAMGSTARQLFPMKHATVDDAMPEPKRSAKTKKDAITLESFAECETQHQASDIGIFTDVQNRVPTMDGQDDDNPFVGPRKTNGKVKDQGKSKNGEHDRHDEGIYYVHRGRKIFRKFEDVPSSEDENLSDTLLRRRAGPVASKRLKRTKAQPRLLFPSADDEEDRINSDDDMMGTASQPNHMANNDSTPMEPSSAQPKMTTPSKVRFRPVTPPTTVRTTRTTKDIEPSSAGSSKNSPFESWRRRKPSETGVKREGEPLEADGSKRPREANAA